MKRMKVSKGQGELDSERKQRKTRRSFRPRSYPVHRATPSNVIMLQFAVRESTAAAEKIAAW